jgi:hypothetical protein
MLEIKSDNTLFFIDNILVRQWPFQDSYHTDRAMSQFIIQVSGFGCREGELLNPET